MAALLLSNSAGLGSGGALFVSVIAGTVLFVVIAGCHRAFFTGLFTGALSVGMFIWSAVYSVFILHESFSRDMVLLPCMLFLFYVLIPVVIAWIVTRILKYVRRDA